MLSFVERLNFPLWEFHSYVETSSGALCREVHYQRVHYQRVHCTCVLSEFSNIIVCDCRANRDHFMGLAHFVFFA